MSRLILDRSYRGKARLRTHGRKTVVVEASFASDVVMKSNMEKLVNVCRDEPGAV